MPAAATERAKERSDEKPPREVVSSRFLSLVQIIFLLLMMLMMASLRSQAQAVRDHLGELQQVQEHAAIQAQLNDLNSRVSRIEGVGMGVSSVLVALNLLNLLKKGRN